MKKELNHVSIKMVLDIFMMIVVLGTALMIGACSYSGIKKISQVAVGNYEKAMEEGYSTEIRSEVQTAIAVLQTEYEKAQAGLISEQEAKENAKEIVRGMRYREDQGGYFWIDDIEYTLVMHPILPDQEGSNRYDLKDQNGVYIIREIMDEAHNTSEDGLNSFLFTKSDGVTVAPKVSYSQLFEPWGWVISTGNYIDEMEAEMKETNEAILGLASSMNRTLVGICVVALVIFCVSGRIFGNWLCNPIIQLVKEADKLSEGKVDSKLARRNGKSEIIQLQNRFCDMIDTFRNQAEVIEYLSQGNLQVDIQVKSQEDVVGNALHKLITDNNLVFSNIQDMVMKIDQGSNQIAAASQNLAEGATEQASAVQQIMASVTEIASQSRNNANEVEKVKRMVFEADERLNVGNQKMREMVQATEEIRAASEDIQKVIKAIDDIAFNTNILALNASVEAARAGEHGKGFGVVAEEVRNLAGRSAQASGQTAEMLENAIVKILRGSELAKDTEKVLEEISVYIREITVLSKNIAEASSEQAASATQIDKALAQVTDITHMNSAASEECAASSEELAHLANGLNRVVDRFHLKARK